MPRRHLGDDLDERELQLAASTAGCTDLFDCSGHRLFLGGVVVLRNRAGRRVSASGEVFDAVWADLFVMAAVGGPW